MKSLLLTTFIILFLTSACSNKQPEIVIETNQAENVSTEQVQIDVVKKAEDEECLVVRMHECRGGRSEVTLTSEYPVKRIVPCNLIEHNCGEAVEGASVEFEVKPFEIKTFKLFF